MIKEDLRKWFKEKWVRFDTKGNIKGQCARDEGEGKPKCLPMAKAQALGKEARAKAAKRKRRKDPVANRKGKGGKPINVRTESFDPKELEAVRKVLTGEQPDKGNVGGNLTAEKLIAMHNAMHKSANDPDNKKTVKRYVDTLTGPETAKVIPFKKPVKEEYLEEKNVPTNPKLWAQAKSLAKKKFDVYPSAYANGWASKWYKSKGGGWKTLKEDRREQSKTFFMESLGYELVEKKVEKDHEKEMARTQLKTATNAIQRLMKRIGSGEGQLEAWVQSKITKAVDYIDSVADYMDNNDKEIKEAIELANQAREYISEEMPGEKEAATRNQNVRTIIHGILKRDPKSGVTTQNVPGMSNALVDDIAQAMRDHGLHHSNVKKAIGHEEFGKKVKSIYNQYLEDRKREDDADY